MRIMAELHKGICGSHIGGRALATRTLRAGYYWPTMREDCKKYAQCCKQCQQHADWHKAPPVELKSIYSPWPFHTWGIDILGPFPLAIRQMKYLVVTIEYFMILPVDSAQERCLVTVFPTSLSPHVLQAHTPDSLSENLKNTQWRLGGRWRSDAQVSDKNTQKTKRKICSVGPYCRHTTLAVSAVMKRTSANSVKVTFIARFLLSPGRYAFGRVPRI